MMPPHDAGCRIHLSPRRRKDPLPRKFAGGERELPIKCVGEHNRPVASSQVALVQSLNCGQLHPQGGYQSGREHGSAITPSLSATDDHFAPLKIDILHAEATALGQAEPASVQQGGHEPGDALHGAQHPADLATGKHRWDMVRPFGGVNPVRRAHRDPKNLAIEEHQGGQGLILGGSRDAASRPRQGRQKITHGTRIEFAWVPQPVESHIPLDPRGVRGHRAGAVPPRSENVVELVQQAGRGHPLTLARGE